MYFYVKFMMAYFNVTISQDRNTHRHLQNPWNICILIKLYRHVNVTSTEDTDIDN